MLLKSILGVHTGEREFLLMQGFKISCILFVLFFTHVNFKFPHSLSSWCFFLFIFKNNFLAKFGVCSSCVHRSELSLFLRTSVMDMQILKIHFLLSVVLMIVISHVLSSCEYLGVWKCEW